MTLNPTPAIWLIVLIIGLPLLSETAYSPALPAIAQALGIEDTLAEYTLTIYLAGFAVGTLFWGKFSDAYGRKSCLIIGMAIYCLACIGCYFANTIESLMISRFIQAFGGSVGSVLGQAICRDAFQGQALSRVYATAGAALAAFPAIGPIIGGVIAEAHHWSAIFIFLTLFGMIVLTAVTLSLPETNLNRTKNLGGMVSMIRRMSTDKSLLGFALIVAACNGIVFSYYAEGSFYMIELLGLNPSEYGLSYIGIAIAAMLGATLSRKLLKTLAPKAVMNHGLTIILLTCLTFTGLAFYTHHVGNLAKTTTAMMTLVCMMGIMGGVSMTTSNALSLALVNYRDAIGTASSLFGGFYYGLISLFTLGMGLVHQGTLLEMPIYFLSIGAFMHLVSRKLI